MSEVRSVEVGFLPDTMDAEHHFTHHGLLEGQTCIRSQYGRAEVHADGHNLVVVALEHLFEQSAFLEVFTGDSEACQVFQLAPEVLDEVLEGVGIAVNLQEEITVLLVCEYHVEFFVLSDLRYGFKNQFHLVEDEHDITNLLVFGDLRFRGFVPCIFLCHNI